MKKIAAIVLVLLFVAGGFAVAQTWGVGASFGLDAVGGLPQQAMLSVKAPQLPVLWGLGLQLGQDQFNMGLTADWWLYNENLFSFVNLYVGPGLYAALPEPFELGGRVPIGINAYPVDVFEVFFEIAPTLLLISDRGGVSIPEFSLQGAIGFRFWFDS